MSTDLLYNGFKIEGYHQEGVYMEEKKLIIKVRSLSTQPSCPVCNSRWIVRRGSYIRRFRSVPIGCQRVWIELAIPRVGCHNCGAIRQMPVPFAKGQRSYTHAFERYVLDLCKCMTMQDIASHLAVSWDVIKGIQKEYLEKKYATIALAHVRRIAIDEIAIGKGHRYLTVVLDLESGAVVFVGNGKGADALLPFWQQLKDARANVHAVATDMSPAYISAVKTNLSDAALVFDHFHVIKLYNEKLSELRRDLQREATEKLHKKVLKGTRWLLLMNPENLDEEKKEDKRLQEALEMNKPLATAYYMKEDLRRVWKQPNKAKARRILDYWIRCAEKSGIRMLMTFAKTMAAYRNQILNYYDYRISTGPLEGTNTKIRVMQRQAYGFRDPTFFMLKIYDLHETRFALVG